MRGSCPRLRNRKRTRRITVRLLAASLKAPKKRAHVLGLRVIGTVDRLEDGERAIEVEARLDRIALRCNHEPKASVHAGDVRMLRVVRVLDDRECSLKMRTRTEEIPFVEEDCCEIVEPNRDVRMFRSVRLLVDPKRPLM